MIPWSSLLLSTNEHPKNLIPFVLLPSSEKAVNKRMMQMSFNMVRTGVLSTVLFQWCTIYPIRLNPRPPSPVSKRSQRHISPVPPVSECSREHISPISPSVRAESRTHLSGPPGVRAQSRTPLLLSKQSQGHIPRSLDSAREPSLGSLPVSERSRGHLLPLHCKLSIANCTYNYACFS